MEDDDFAHVVPKWRTTTDFGWIEMALLIFFPPKKNSTRYIKRLIQTRVNWQNSELWYQFTNWVTNGLYTIKKKGKYLVMRLRSQKSLFTICRWFGPKIRGIFCSNSFFLNQKWAENGVWLAYQCSLWTNQHLKASLEHLKSTGSMFYLQRVSPCFAISRLFKRWQRRVNKCESPSDFSYCRSKESTTSEHWNRTGKAKQIQYDSCHSFYLRSLLPSLKTKDAYVLNGGNPVIYLTYLYSHVRFVRFVCFQWYCIEN